MTTFSSQQVAALPERVWKASAMARLACPGNVDVDAEIVALALAFRAEQEALISKTRLAVFSALFPERSWESLLDVERGYCDLIAAGVVAA